MDDNERFNIYTKDADDVMDVIQFNGIDKDGLHWRDWYKRIESGDALYNIMMIIVRNRKDPKYAELVSELEAEIQGWL